MNSEHSHLLPLSSGCGAAGCPLRVRKRGAGDLGTVVILNWGLQVIFRPHCSHVFSDFFLPCLPYSQNCVDAYPTFLVVLWTAGLLCSQGNRDFPL